MNSPEPLPLWSNSVGVELDTNYHASAPATLIDNKGVASPDISPFRAVVLGSPNKNIDKASRQHAIASALLAKEDVVSIVNRYSYATLLDVLSFIRSKAKEETDEGNFRTSSVLYGMAALIQEKYKGELSDDQTLSHLSGIKSVPNGTTDRDTSESYKQAD